MREAIRAEDARTKAAEARAKAKSRNTGRRDLDGVTIIRPSEHDEADGVTCKQYEGLLSDNGSRDGGASGAGIRFSPLSPIAPPARRKAGPA